MFGKSSFTGILGEALRTCVVCDTLHVSPCLSRATRGQRNAHVFTYLARGPRTAGDPLVELLRGHCLNSPSSREYYYSHLNPLACIGVRCTRIFSIKCSGCLISCEQLGTFWYNYSPWGRQRYVCGHCLADDMLVWLVSSEDYPRMARFTAEHRCRVITCLAGQMSASPPSRTNPA